MFFCCRFGLPIKTAEGENAPKISSERCYYVTVRFFFFFFFFSRPFLLLRLPPRAVFLSDPVVVRKRLKSEPNLPVRPSAR